MYFRKYYCDSDSGLRYWLPCEVLELIEVFESHQYLFGVMSSNDDVWILIASALQRRGIEVTSRQVKKKWLSMRGTFHRISKAEFVKPLKLCSHLHCYDHLCEADLTTCLPARQRCYLSDICNHTHCLDTCSYENLKRMYELSKKLRYYDYYY